jgi:hypothetical protein
MYLYDSGRFGFAAGCLLATLRYGLAIKPARLPVSQPTGTSKSKSKTAHVLLVLGGDSLTGVPSRSVNLLTGMNSTSQDTGTSRSQNKDSPVTPKNGRDR